VCLNFLIALLGHGEGAQVPAGARRKAQRWGPPQHGVELSLQQSPSATDNP
jgi:hypothetical protein